ncbi:MAG: ANTAR domain-containing protein [Candidatus Macondimonas sp.]
MLKVMLVDDDPGRGAILRQALTDAGYAVFNCPLRGVNLLAELQRSGADVIIVDMDVPDRDTLESVRHISRDYPRPVVMYAESADADIMRQAVQAGVSAYVVDDINPRRVKPILEVAVARFKEFQALRDELEKTRNTLAERKVVDRAKGILMKKRGMDEETAYQALRKLAMDRNQRLADVARTVVEMAELLG